MSGYSGYVTSFFSSNSSNQQPAQNQNQSSYQSHRQPRTQYDTYNQPQSTHINPSLPAQNYPTSAQPTTTASSTSSWTSSLSSRLANLRKGLTAFSSADEKDDPDSEDSSHVSTVLRAYYIEKGRPFPPWLPPDPKYPSPQPVVQQPQQSNYGGYAGYGASQNAYGQPTPRGSSGASSGGGLTDLFGNSSTSPTPPQSASQSLRNRPGQRPVPQNLASRAASPPVEQQQVLNTRLLPSQRAGSYQQQQQQQQRQGSTGSVGGVGSRDRLRARLQGGGSGRNSPVPLAPPSDAGGYSSQTSRGSGSGSYGQSAFGGGVAGGNYSSQGGGGGGAPYMSSSQPWSSGGNDGALGGGYGGGGGGVEYGNDPAPAPASVKRQPPGGMGLPSGPRMRPGGPR